MLKVESRQRILKKRKLAEKLIGAVLSRQRVPYKTAAYRKADGWTVLRRSNMRAGRPQPQPRPIIQYSLSEWLDRASPADCAGETPTTPALTNNSALAFRMA